MARTRVLLFTDVEGSTQITEQLGPELLAHFRVEGLPVAHPEARRRVAEDDESAKLADTVVGRFEPDANLDYLDPTNHAPIDLINGYESGGQSLSPGG